MFLVSGPDLVVAACRAGVVGTFPALNQRTTEGYIAWLDDIESRLQAARDRGERPAPYGVNLIVHKTNERLQADLEVTIQRRVPLVITSLGAVSKLVESVHAYGGLVYHDVINARHARKAADAGVDGLIAVAAGAGGHAGNVNPFALLAELRSFFSGTILLAGGISTGRDIAAAEMMGADLAYLGTRFIATRESLAPDAYKQMIVDSTAKDVLYTDRVTGISANFLRPSLVGAGLDPDNLQAPGEVNVGAELEHARAWRDLWSAGQGVGAIADIPTTADLCERLVREYHDARDG